MEQVLGYETSASDNFNHRSPALLLSLGRTPCLTRLLFRSQVTPYSHGRKDSTTISTRRIDNVLRSARIASMKVEVEIEEDGRWIAEIPELPGVMAYGADQHEAIQKTEALALRVIADRIEHGERFPELDQLFKVPA